MQLHRLQQVKPYDSYCKKQFLLHRKHGVAKTRIFILQICAVCSSPELAYGGVVYNEGEIEGNRLS